MARWVEFDEINTSDGVRKGVWVAQWVEFDEINTSDGVGKGVVDLVGDPMGGV